jgi:hypothetical protein
MKPRSLVAVVLALAAGAAGAGCSSKSSSAPAAGSGSAAAGRTIAPITKPVRPGQIDPAAPQTAPLAPADVGAGRAGDFRERMKQFDTNGDGRLDEDERYHLMVARAGAMVARNDTDGDGALSPAELAASPIGARLGDFAAADTNHDGKLSPDELGAAVVERMKQAGGFRAWRGPNGSGVVPPPSPDDSGGE